MALPALNVDVDELTLLRLAREIAMDIHDIETILNRYHIDTQSWMNLKNSPTFQRYLKQETEAWESAGNTHERVKIKAAALVEEWMPELYARLNDRAEPLSSKIEGGKLITKIAGMGIDKAEINGSGGERFSVTINLGADAKLQFEKQLPMKVIDAEPLKE